MTVKEAKVKLAELNAEEQRVTHKIAVMSAVMSDLETKRERIRLQAAEVWLEQVKAEA